MDLPEDVPPEMVEALKRGEDVRMPDGSPVRMFRPFAGDEYGEWSVVIVREQVGTPISPIEPGLWRTVPSLALIRQTDAMVPEELLTRLIGWQQEFESNFHWETGWQSDEAKLCWAEEATVLAAEVRAALEGKAELTVDLWPLETT